MLYQPVELVAGNPRGAGPPARGPRGQQARGGAPRVCGAVLRAAAVLHERPGGHGPNGGCVGAGSGRWHRAACITACTARPPAARTPSRRGTGSRAASGGGAARPRAAQRGTGCQRSGRASSLNHSARGRDLAPVASSAHQGLAGTHLFVWRRVGAVVEAEFGEGAARCHVTRNCDRLFAVPVRLGWCHGVRGHARM